MAADMAQRAMWESEILSSVVWHHPKASNMSFISSKPLNQNASEAGYNLWLA
jgi:hypothetical protein